MPTSLFDQEVNDILTNISQPIRTKVKITGFAEPVEITEPFASPEDWRDKWIYFLMIDRFNNPSSPPLPQQSDWDRCTEGRQFRSPKATTF